MSGTSSAHPTPEAAPLTPEQSKAYALTGVYVTGASEFKVKDCAVHFSDAQMLDWVLEHRAQIIRVHDELPVYAHYWTTAGEQYGPDAATPRDAVLAAMKEQPK